MEKKDFIAQIRQLLPHMYAMVDAQNFTKLDQITYRKHAIEHVFTATVVLGTPPGGLQTVLKALIEDDHMVTAILLKLFIDDFLAAGSWDFHDMMLKIAGEQGGFLKRFDKEFQDDGSMYVNGIRVTMQQETGES